MLAVTPDRWGWVRRHPLDVVIVLFTSPFMPASWQAARAFRLLRALRLLRIFSMRKLVSLEGVRAAAFLAAFTVLAGGAIFASVERGANPRVDSTFDGIWWAMSTVTTVGYGDIIPKTDVGRAIGITIMLAGIGFVALLTAYVAERFVNTSHAVSEHEEHLVAELRTISERLHRLEARTAGRAEAVNGVTSGTNGAAEPQLTAGR